MSPQANDPRRSTPLSGPRIHVTDVTSPSSPPTPHPFASPRVSEGGDGRGTGRAGGAGGAGGARGARGAGVRNDCADQFQLITGNLEHAPFINRRVGGGQIERDRVGGGGGDEESLLGTIRHNGVFLETSQARSMDSRTHSMDSRTHSMDFLETSQARSMASFPPRHQTGALTLTGYVIGVGDVIEDPFSPLSSSSDEAPLSHAPSCNLWHQEEREKVSVRESVRKDPLGERTGAEGHQERERERGQASEREEAQGSGREKEGEGEEERAGGGGPRVDLSDNGISASADAELSAAGSPNRNAAGIFIFYWICF